MSELAFNLNGDPFDVPSNAVGWRVRKMKNKGAPEVAYGRNGQPLVLPLEAEIDDLRAEVGAPGRYRLDPIDDHNKPIANAPAGYVMVHELASAPSTGATPTAITPLAPLPAATDSVVIEAMRMNAEITRLVVDRFPQMMEAAASLLRAADGAGLPQRKPREVGADLDDNDDEDDQRQAPMSPGFELMNNLVAQIAPIVMTSLVNKKMPKLGAVLDWRKAVPQVEAPTTPAADHMPSDSAELPPLDPKMMSHFLAIQSALAPAEAALARQVAAELTPAELRQWFADLSAMSVPDAIAKIRAIVATPASTGGAS